jgi:hypothetical protein
MAHVISRPRFWLNVRRLFEHTATVVIGLLFMILGLAMGVTMVMLPIGIVVGLAGVACVAGGLFARIDER